MLIGSRQQVLAHVLPTLNHGFGFHVEIKKLRRTLYGARSERSARLQDQLELELEELEAAATQDELAAEKANASRIVFSAGTSSS